MLNLIKFVGMASLIIGAFLDSVKSGFMAAGIILLIDYMIAFAGSIVEYDNTPTKMRHDPVPAPKRNTNSVPSNIPMPPKPSKK